MRHNVYLIAVLAAALSACGGVAAGPQATGLPAGTYRGSGTGAALESLTALAVRFQLRHPGVVFKLEDVGADTSVALVANGDSDFGFLSRDLKTDEKSKLTAIPYAGTGTGLAVNPANAVTGLTTEQVRKIYTGEITDWSQVGGKPGDIRPLVRESGSSTRASFEAYFFGGKPTYGKNVIEVVESGSTYQALRDFKGAIAMVTIQKTTAEDSTLRLLSLDGIAATTRNVNSGAYPVRRPIILTVHADPGRTKPAVAAFFEFIKTAEGQEILAGF
ncbi:MAG TPA: substrate-binding domain-containing protein [Candidatus Limnocylindria bacterium]|jgi:phosphate transport system substrate-binding protein|nr:substrate-binding domain-containing protein [Candidatus Limnocylindria bacterium]